MKITSVEAIPLAVPYRRPFAFASGTVTAADHVLVRITTDDGLVGHGEAPPRPDTYGETAASIIAAVRDLFVNPNGSGISLGHPVGATGVRILATMLREMDRREARYGLETMCIGGGQGLAAIFERVT